ncbi:hypothetical protein AVI53_08810 [Piscirickettsia salmonis]|uniref:Nuclease n=1 Tax=Piscirickettsia salmonis TaxID=1238 RepID=A0AAC8VKM5_PISSA|nr:nuclease [Piscirickettsia salmonis]ALT18710.1 hypothetical protein PSLF89_07750 [Piscirickettsia salmonis LF-89 = ATCC VR-1361]ALY03924.1 hypothetical protein AWE47_14500 [Piscirickettsia salmonis]AMA43485.1 hypothetical protein AWJ11_14715 [Piscirickettsia salmonis]AOS35954.1 hypothetical protein AVM72_11830 [Piscirickettsia salmonis]
MECAASRHVTLCDADSRGFIVVAFCSAILHHWMCKIPTEVATLTEINFNSLKTIMSMDHLRSKTPDMVHKEIAVHFLAYNLIRTLIAEACRNTERLPIQVSFKGVIQLFNSFVSLLSFSADCNKAHAILLHAIIKNKVGNRPGRIEPRAVKKRPKAFRRLNKSRELEKAEITKRMKKNSNKKCSSAP